jgi:hypothetical protein
MPFFAIARPFRFCFFRVAQAPLQVSQNDSPGQAVFLGQLVEEGADIFAVVHLGERKMAATHHLKVVGPSSEKCTVALPVRKPNAAYRPREHLTEREVERLIEAAKDNRWGHRDATMVLLSFRHGLRASELVDLRWEQRHPARPQSQARHSRHAPTDRP